MAKAANVAVSTVADFERNARTPTSANAHAIETAFEAQGITFLAGGAVDGAKLAPTIAPPGPGAPMRWFDATTIAQWAERRTGGQSDLPQLISDLILSCYGPAAHIHMPSGDSVQYGGYDGRCTVNHAIGIVPAGTSVWEFGSQRTRIRQKAQGDYDKRTNEPGAVNRADTTFVFVTPHRWSDKDKWAKEQQKKGDWAGVVALDVNDLVHWLETTPDVGLRWADRLGRRPKGLRELRTVFEEWSRVTRPRLPANLLLIGRDNEAVETLRWLRGPASVYPVQAEAADEAMSFLYGAIDPLPEPHRSFWLTRCVVAETDEIARDLVGIGAKLVVVMNAGERGLAQRLADDGHHVFLTFGSDLGLPAGVRRLPRLNRYDIERALIDIDVPGDKAHAYAAQAAGSLTVLRRIMHGEPGRSPAWAKPTRAMVAALMVGAWCDDRPADRAIVSEMAGLPYEDLAAEFAALASFDGPLRRSGEVWKLASLRDAWLVLAPHLTRADIERHNELFLKVMSGEAGDFDTRLDANFIYRVPKPDEAPISGYVRHGLSEALVAMGAFPTSAQQVGLLTSYTSSALRKLLSGGTHRLWWSLRSDFRLLAEAAPATFLELLDEAYQRADCPLRPLFECVEEGISPREYHYDLLWALELLAWDPLYLSEAAQLLADLDAMSHEGRSLNRPLTSLQRIFMPWTPQTFATASERRDVVLGLVRRFPAVGWRLLRAIAPTGHGMSMPTVKPTWRDCAPDQREVLTWPLVYDAHRWIGEALLIAAGDDLDRWSELTEHWANFDSVWRSSALEKLKALLERSADISRRNAVREKIRELAAVHRSFSDADWAMPIIEVEALEALVSHFEPSDPAIRHAWLFDSGRGYHPKGLSWREAKTQEAASQSAAIQEIADQLGIPALITFALGVRQTFAVGEAIERAGLGAQTFDDILSSVLDADHGHADDLARILLGCLHHHEPGAVTARFNTAVKSQATQRHLIRLALALPAQPDSWALIDAAGGDLGKVYWKAMSIHAIDREVPALTAINRLLENARLGSAIDLASIRIEAGEVLPTERLIDLLDRGVSIDLQDHEEGMFACDRIGEIFKYLDSCGDVEDSQMVALEWAYHSVLEHSDYRPRRVERALSSNPEFFMQLIQLIYLPEPESGIVEPRTPARMEAAVSQAYRVLDEFSHVPGTDDNGVIDAAKLEAWIKAARIKAAAVGRADMTDWSIGRLLAGVSRQDEGAWPPEPVREMFEVFRSREMEVGFEYGVYNRRGVTVRMPGDGGAQERALVQRYRKDAKDAGIHWPRIRAVLERIAERYELEAVQEDQSAERRSW
ncbi:hypothetical protein [Novosphingobium kaempferiae]|uniref:hypothetical protein n=1 Tax=Novosphingobium kaempferiae TaxID=2896849 RepID=UPI001E57B4EA|nr:hypothetical protein [Novosphingobium kaempferiae]